MKKKYWNNSTMFLFCMTFLLCIIIPQTGYAQDNPSSQVSGTVTSASDGLGIPGVNVIIKGTHQGTTTDFDGNYQIEVGENTILQFSYVGYITQDVEVSGRTQINISLKEDMDSLDEVIVVGYGVQKKALVTGANFQIKGEDLQKLSTTNALQALQGQSPGVQITSTSGQPGEGLNVVIRGMGSTGSNGPLYVVDGVLTGDISYLNNSDIGSITVLKDAASAAIYGSQAANGVVLVTTKGGKRGPAQITFDQYYGIQSVPKKIDMLNGREYGIILNEAAVNSGKLPYFTNDEIDGLGDGTNWMDEVFEDNAVTQNYTLGASGGSETSIYSTSLSYLSQEGIVGGKDLSNYERYNFRFNSEHKLYDDKITIGENLSFAYTNKNGIGVGNQYNNALRGAFGASPLIPMFDDQGNFYDTSNDTAPWLAGQSNPYASMFYGNQNEGDNQKLLGNFYVEFEPIENLTFRTSLGIDYNAYNNHSFSPIYRLSQYSFSTYSTAYQSIGKNKSLVWDNLLTYKFDLKSDHHFETLLGTSSFKYDGTYMNGSNANLIFDDLKHAWLDNATNAEGSLISLSGGPNNENKRMSYFGRLNYNYKETYLLNTTFRADGSSQFHKDNRWGYFPSVSLGWVASNENFLINSEAINFFKLRASWGQVGNQNAGNYQYLAPITYSNVNYTFGHEEGVLTPGAYPRRLANPDLKWETSEQINIGFDARLLNNKLDVNFDLYNKKNKDWLIKAPIPATAGAEAPWINGGDITNKGVELALNYHNNIGDFNYSIGANGSYNQNKVGNIPTEDGIIHGETNQLYDNSSEFYRAQEGFPLGYFWGLQTAGVFQTEEDVNNYTNLDQKIQPNASPGDLIYVDVNNDGLINELDKKMIGDPNPDYVFGISLSMDYKAFDFSALANGVAGNQIVQSYRNQSNAYGNYTTAILDRWHGAGSSNTTPRVTENNKNWTTFSDRYIQDGDFLRISNVTLGYDFAKLNKNIFASQVRLYVSALNLYTFTKYNGMDPEVGYGISTDDYNFSSGVDVGYYPRPRTLLVGLNVKF